MSEDTRQNRYYQRQAAKQAEVGEIGPPENKARRTRYRKDLPKFLRGTSGRFQIDKVIPVSGVGIIIGSSDDGSTLHDVVSDIDGINERIKYL